MMPPATGEQLIRELLTNPRVFSKDGRAYDLLQAYFAGLPLETLRPLLRDDDLLVRRAAAFVAEELGIQAQSLIDDILPLLASGDRYLQYHAMEALAVCSQGEQAAAFKHVARGLENDDDVLRFRAMELGRDMWTYATCSVSTALDEEPIELHLFSPVQAEELVELLTVVAHFHITGARLGLGHTVNFGRPWLPGSRCSFGLISHPYLDGPSLEVARGPAFRREVRCLWLIPITA
jgi:hypothetical protein